MAVTSVQGSRDSYNEQGGWTSKLGFLAGVGREIEGLDLP